ncbi:Glyco_transf_34 domain-containing protein [Cephalotus follicularis]|uniref:Glyco_transf_34 domain-containing protein n=1 Tax=Cephalotus follicularis TaxID=3775 RepID=A0A1Q3AQ79_CEPFO|nr:Glyco_transf_34 domain-containing protein [Cephalotus follicularis]
MVSSESMSQYHNTSPMAKQHSARNKAYWCITDGFLFLGGALLALLMVFSFWSFFSPTPSTSSIDAIAADEPYTKTTYCERDPKGQGVNLRHDPLEFKTFYDDPELSYTIDSKVVQNWDDKRRQWLKHHPSFASGVKDRVVLVTGSQPTPCKNPIGDHLLLRFFKNKVDYCRIHGYDIFYTNALLDKRMNSYWAKLPAVKAAMVAHPEAEWIWWVDSDALFTDMEFKLPLERYKDHNLVVHGWPHLIYESKSWTSLNAGVFLIRNCQWSMDLIHTWANMGPISPDYQKWGSMQRSLFKDKLFPESDDQSALIYLLYTEKEKYYDKIFLVGEYYFEGYWVEIVPNYHNVSERYLEMERGAAELRRRHAEKVSERYGDEREKYLREAGNGRGSWRRPFITHFTGCQPCSGDHNQMYAGETCWSGMVKALNFADNQIMRKFGFVHPDLLTTSPLTPVPFDYPDEGPW